MLSAKLVYFANVFLALFFYLYKYIHTFYEIY